jgi:DNA processing protein
VFAVPGSPLDPRARGVNDLIRQGATLVETAADVLADLPLHPGRAAGSGPQFPRRGMLLEPPGAGPEPPTDPPPDAGTTERILDLLGASGTSVDELIRRSQLPPGAVMAVLLTLEVAGRVEMLPGNMVALLAEPGH